MKVNVTISKEQLEEIKAMEADIKKSLDKMIIRQAAEIRAEIVLSRYWGIDPSLKALMMEQLLEKAFKRMENEGE